MTGKSLTTATRILIATGLVVGVVLIGAACTTEKEVEVTREVPVTVEVPMNLAETAEAIRTGEIDVGTEYGVAPGKRYHTIHATVLGLACATCHVMGTPDTVQTLFTTQDVSPAAPGPVDKRACLGCHSAAGPARVLYESGTP